jgi:hypothetical protein
MFNITGKKNYKVLFINGGTGKNGRAYTFITIEEIPREGLKYGEKAKIQLWGEDLSQTVRPEDYIKILGCTDCGLEDKKDEKSGKWFKNFTMVCQAGDVVIGEKPVKKVEQPTIMQPIDDGELPF